MQSLAVTDETNVPASTTSKPSQSIFAKLTDAKKTFFGRSSAPDPSFSSATQNKALLTYVLSEPQPLLEVIQEFERNGAQLNAVTEEGNTILHLLARAEQQSAECIPIVEYLTKKGGCDPNKQNDYGWTAGILALLFENLV
jgi:ankyrin repeat protein